MKLRRLFQAYGTLHMAEALKLGANRKALYAMVEAGELERLSRGVYRLASLPELAQADLVTVATRVPSGVICLISALAFHELTTQVPHAVDVALPRGAEPPRIDYPPVNVYWFSPKRFSCGIEQHTVDGVTLAVYNREKAVVDAFIYRNKLGLDVAIEALRTWQRTRGSSPDALLECARRCRIASVLQPYLEATL